MVAPAVATDALQARNAAELTAWSRNWLQKYGVAGYVGEFGVPNAAYGVAADAPLWAADVDVYLKQAEYLGVHTT